MTMSTTMPQTVPTGPETPRSREVLIEHVRASAFCLRCCADDGKPCEWQGRQGVHLGRFVQAFKDGSITAAETALTIVEGVNRRAYLRHGIATIVRIGGRPAEPGTAEEDAPQLYVVWEIDDRDPEDTRRTVVTDPKPRAEAEQFAEREARYFAGRLEVAPARPEDLADADGTR